MPLAIVATPGADDANAYADQDQANAYLSFRVGVSNDLPDWSDLDADAQIRALVTASRRIDTIPWEALRGDAPSSSTQGMAWPRGGAVVLPKNLVYATIELGLTLITAAGDDATDSDVDAAFATASTANVKREKVDVIETEYFAPSDKEAALSGFPAIVQSLLRPLVETRVNSFPVWGSGRAVRAS